jgi:predicted RNase H-like HicB family nuclease
MVTRWRSGTTLSNARKRASAFRSDLPGCWSQGRDADEAIENIQDAIREYLAVAEEQSEGVEVREIEVTL